ncbi:MAG: hypothetical protein GX621_18870 [Pirellulaceae bacterium]|nr:hypothetical protein [Pirellulaceae bacterium]
MRLTASHVKEAAGEVRQAARSLEARLLEDGRNGESWRKYVGLDELETELVRAEGPNLAKLDAVYTRLNRDYRGLELVWFVDLRIALRRYLNVARAIDNPDIETAFKNLVEKTLPDKLAEFKSNPTPATAGQIGTVLGWLTDFRQAKELVARTRGEYLHPNLFIEVSSDFLGSGMGGPVDETTDIADCILGTTIRGTGRTRGQLAVETVPDDRRAILKTTLSAKTDSDNIGYHGPVQVFTTGVTTFEGRKQFTITPEGIAASPAASEATTSTTINCIRSRRGSQMVEKAAWKRAYKQKCQAEAIASQRAEVRINQRMDSQAAEFVAEGNERYRKRLRVPLSERKIFPEELVFSTTADSLNVRALRAAYDQLAAATPPPALAGPADLTVRVHESMINNSAATLLAGREVTEEEFLKTVEDILGEVPENLRPDDDKPTWAIHFAPRDAFVVTFRDGGFTVLLQATGYKQAGKGYPGMNISATYKIDRTDDGFVAVRQGDIEVFPPGFVKGERQLSGGEQTIRSMLEKRFVKVFDEKIVPRGYLELKEGRWEKIGRVPLAEWSTDGGWMTLAWKMDDKAD